MSREGACKTERALRAFENPGKMLIMIIISLIYLLRECTALCYDFFALCTLLLLLFPLRKQIFQKLLLPLRFFIN